MAWLWQNGGINTVSHNVSSVTLTRNRDYISFYCSLIISLSLVKQFSISPPVYFDFVQLGCHGLDACQRTHHAEEIMISVHFVPCTSTVEYIQVD